MIAVTESDLSWAAFKAVLIVVSAFISVLLLAWAALRNWSSK